MRRFTFGFVVGAVFTVTTTAWVMLDRWICNVLARDEVWDWADPLLQEPQE